MSRVNEIRGIFCRGCDSLFETKREAPLSGNRSLEDEIMTRIDQRSLRVKELLRIYTYI